MIPELNKQEVEASLACSPHKTPETLRFNVERVHCIEFACDCFRHSTDSDECVTECVAGNKQHNSTAICLASCYVDAATATAMSSVPQLAVLCCRVCWPTGHKASQCSSCWRPWWPQTCIFIPTPGRPRAIRRQTRSCTVATSCALHPLHNDAKSDCVQDSEGAD